MRPPPPSPAVHFRRSTLAACLALTPVATAAADTWLPVLWHGENAYELETATWRAIVSVDRGRLVHFGPTGRDQNLLFAPPTMDEPDGWGGHRVWLGPQLNWSAIWPPPAAWEASAPEIITPAGARLELRLPAAGDGWPTVTRVYEPLDGRLACRVRTGTDGTRDAQVIQIFQTPPPTELAVPVQRTDALPHGCVLLPPVGGRREAVALRELPPHVYAVGSTLHLRQAKGPEKIGFPPQELLASFAHYILRVGRGTERGIETGAPDRGFYTQVYLGDAGTPVIELEQLSPRFKAGVEAESVVLLDLVEQ